jgi:hypothetical protein
MTEQIETYLREQFAADAERAPQAHDLARTARAQVRRQRRRTAVVLVSGLAALALAAGVTYGLGGSSQTVGPPAKQDNASPSPTQSAPFVEREVLAVLNSWLEAPNDWTRDIAVVPGGSTYCESVLVSTSANVDDLYVWALCAHVYANDGKATIGSASSGPLVMHVDHQIDGDTLVVTRVNGIAYPREATLEEDILRLFPAGIADQMRSGELVGKPTEASVLERAAADMDKGLLGASTGPGVLAAHFLAYARGEQDDFPYDTPVNVYLGNKFQKTIDLERDGGLSSWEVCARYAGRSCPVSAITELRDTKVGVVLASDVKGPCLATLADVLTPAPGGDTVVYLTSEPSTDCMRQYAVQIWSNDVGQITAVNLLLGSP